ncbi:MAG: CoA ester lyase [Actinomycetota bacterium]|nr:MAG: CoA ester lyase [Actinomycetota bacterium]
MADRTRLHRSELAVPATNARAIEKAPSLGADVVFLDLEDAVAPGDKERARAAAIDALRSRDWSSCTISVRINGLDTPWCYRDVVEVVEQAGDVVDTLLVPKVGHPEDVAFVATLLDQIEAARGLEPGRIGLSVLIETARGIANVEAIARARPDRLESMVFGVADYAASVRARTTAIGGANPDYAVLTDPLDDEGRRDRHWGDQWHFALSRIVAACRAEGLRPIDGPFGDHGDAAGYLAAARRAAALGCEGKWAIHPSQVALANEVFTPSAEEVERAERIVAAMREAAARGQGAASLDGRLIDAASIRMAENLLRAVEQLRARGEEPGGEPT